jgi:ribulose-5-phosphate 4-epimerase/fuculose-1-phosphate aldolase
MAASAGAAISLSAFAQGQSPTAAAAPGASNVPGEENLRTDLAGANHFLAEQEVVGGYGHVSVRDPTNPNRYLMSRSIAPALATPADILVFDLDSNPINAPGAELFNERFIHGEIYRARSDVKAVVHAHATALIPFSVLGIQMRPAWHLAAFIGQGVPIFEIRDTREPNDKSMLVHTPALGKALARALGDHPAVLMRGHGAAVVGSSLGQAVSRAVYLQKNAIIQAQAMALGQNIKYLDADEVRAMGDNTYDRDWDIWKRQIAVR